MATATNDAPGVISTNEIYTLEELQRRLKLGNWALREARRKGLPVMRIGRRGYVRGSDVLEFLNRMVIGQQP